MKLNILLFCVGFCVQLGRAEHDPLEVRINEVNVQDASRFSEKEFVELQSLKVGRKISLQGYYLVGIHGQESKNEGATIDLIVNLWNRAVSNNR